MTKAKLLFFPLVVPVEETEVSAQIIISKANQGHGIMIRIPLVIESQGKNFLIFSQIFLLFKKRKFST